MYITTIRHIKALHPPRQGVTTTQWKGHREAFSSLPPDHVVFFMSSFMSFSSFYIVAQSVSVQRSSGQLPAFLFFLIFLNPVPFFLSFLSYPLFSSSCSCDGLYEAYWRRLASEPTHLPCHMREQRSLNAWFHLHHKAFNSLWMITAVVALSLSPSKRQAHHSGLSLALPPLSLKGRELRLASLTLTCRHVSTN